MNTDEKLYFDFLSGDHKALEKLIDIYKESLTLYIYGYIKDIKEAENLMIDSFANLVVSEKSFCGKSSLKTYIFKIAKNEALRYLKKQKKHKNNIPLEDLNPHAKEIIFEDFDFYKKEQNYRLYMAMENLTFEYRDVLFFIYFQDMSYKDAGIVMKKSEKQITNLVYRAKKALKEQLNSCDFTF